MIQFKHIQTEVDAAFLYKVLADHEADEHVGKVFREMSDIEYSHARAFLEKNGLRPEQMPPPSAKARFLRWLGGVMGYDMILGILLDTEKQVASNVAATRQQLQQPASISDTAHVTIVQNLLRNSRVSGPNLARFEKRHRSVGGNALRAAVLGGNDGLVSNFSLIMGVAGATNGQKEVLLAGMAGLLAGALSMALGEWISVKSSQELYENQMALEAEELEVNPAGEERELALIYMSKGIPEEQAKQMAADLMRDPQAAHQMLIKEELGINAEDLQGSAMEAAVTSFLLFAVGAIIPLAPFFFVGGLQAVFISASLSAVGLFLIGAVITLFTGKSVWYSGMRQVIFGLAAAGITYGIGRLIGVSVAG
ncbi:MAG TPA: VIT1/CCC1 transporter family protein [Saprospiraceae bacterium]|nr:VIT1/CCC1 transporter family protein [Saprospiraceae bacterium]